MKPSKKLEGSSIVWDNSYVAEPGNSVCVEATEEEFNAVGSYLLSSIASRWPDQTKADDILEIEGLNHFLRNAAHRIAIQLLTRLNGCGALEGDMRLRQKAGNPCIWQQEQIPGMWVDIYDMSLCMNGLVAEFQQLFNAKGTADNLASLANSVMTEFNSKYTGTSESVDSDLIMSGASEAANRAALCRTLLEIVGQYASDSAKAKNTMADDLNRASLAISIGVGVLTLLAAIAALPTGFTSVAALVAFLGGPGYLALGGAIAGATGLGLQAWAQVIKDTEIMVFQDTLAINAVACKWYDTIRTDTDISKEDYQTAIDTSELTGNAPALYNAIKHLIGTDLSYAVFLKIWKREISFGSVIDLDDDCMCDDEGETYIPAIDTDWDDLAGVHGGTLTNLGNGLWRVTFTQSQHDWRAAIHESQNRPFLLTDVVFSGNTQCSVWELPNGEVSSNGCSGVNPSYDTLVMRHVLWTQSWPVSIDFRMVPPA